MILPRPGTTDILPAMARAVKDEVRKRLLKQAREDLGAVIDEVMADFEVAVVHWRNEYDMRDTIKIEILHK
jgi:hypothetical protein